jgi:hypothetical protein
MIFSMPTLAHPTGHTGVSFGQGFSANSTTAFSTNRCGLGPQSRRLRLVSLVVLIVLAVLEDFCINQWVVLADKSISSFWH